MAKFQTVVGGNWGQQQSWPQQQNWQPNWSQQNQQGWNQQDWNQIGQNLPSGNQQGWNPQGPNEKVPQLIGPPIQQAAKDKVSQSNCIVLEIPQDNVVNHFLVDCSPECDCFQCMEKDLEVMPITRSKAKLKPPLDWEEQKDVRDEATDEISRTQKEEAK